MGTGPSEYATPKNTAFWLATIRHLISYHLGIYALYGRRLYLG